MTDKNLEAVRESVFKTYKELHPETKQAIKHDVGERTKKELNRLLEGICESLMLAEREQSLLILSIDEDEPNYEYVRILTRAISLVGSVLLPLDDMIQDLEV